MAHERAEKAATEQASTGSTVVASTDSAILGPFYREGAPRYEHGGDIVLDHSIKAKDGTPGRTCFLHGRVTDVAGKTIAGAHIDVWHTAANGYYEQQDPSQPEYNNRGAFTSDADGKYALRCLVPTAYPIPYDGGAGSILRALDRSPMRPAHIHFFVKAPGHKSLVTQVSGEREAERAGAQVFPEDASRYYSATARRSGDAKYTMRDCVSPSAAPCHVLTFPSWRRCRYSTANASTSRRTPSLRPKTA